LSIPPVTSIGPDKLVAEAMVSLLLCECGGGTKNKNGQEVGISHGPRSTKTP
jgi:hypothetical protein